MSDAVALVAEYPVAAHAAVEAALVSDDRPVRVLMSAELARLVFRLAQLRDSGARVLVDFNAGTVQLLAEPEKWGKKLGA